MAEPGDRIGTYEVIGLVARGGMATVYEAWQPALDRRVALKRLDLRTGDPSLAERFLRESRIAGSLAHPNIVTVYDFFECDGVPYIAMELLPRGSLRPWIAALTEPQALGVLEGVLAGLAHAQLHGVVHRDLKPENLLVTDRGTVKIADFGIAKAFVRLGERMTATGAAIGTPAYMAPEQAMGGAVDARTDLYAVGVIAFELLSGAPPFDGGDAPMAVMYRHVSEPAPQLHGVDPRLAEWVGRLLEKDPAARFATAADAWEALEETVVALHGPYWRRGAALTEPAAATVATDVAAPARTATEATRGLGGPRGPTRPPKIAVAGAAIAAVGAAAILLWPSAGEPPSAGEAAKARSGAAAFDFAGSGRATVVAGFPASGSVKAPGDARPIARSSGDDRLGSAVASGDFDRDGHADLAIGAPDRDRRGSSQVEGAVLVRYGSADGFGAGRPDVLWGPGIDLPSRAARYGAALVATDVDGDGYDDLAVGAPGSDALRDEARGSGAIRVLLGHRDGLSSDHGQTLRRPDDALARFGGVLAAGDVDGDGHEDLVTSAAGEGAPGHATFCRGGPDGPRSCRPLGGLDDAAPSSLAVADVTGDGHADVAGGLPRGGGSVLLWRGTDRGPRERPLRITQDSPAIRGDHEDGDGFGAVLAAADLDDDGFSDLIVAAPGENGGSGRVTVVRGGRAGTAAAGGVVYGQDTPGIPGRGGPEHRFGAALTLLDTHGDAALDLTVATPGDGRLTTLPGVEGGFSASAAVDLDVALDDPVVLGG